jgi:hypothetical protein
MGDNRVPGPVLSPLSPSDLIDDGTTCRWRSAVPGPVCGGERDPEGRLELALLEFETAANNFALRTIRDAPVRLRYKASIEEMSQRIRQTVLDGEATPEAGAQFANSLRNDIMETMRVESSDVGRTVAERMKLQGKTLEELVQKGASENFAKDFTLLSEAERDVVYLKVIESAGRSRPSMNASAVLFGRLGKGFLVLSIGLAVYDIATAEDKVKAVVKEGSSAGVGILGGMAGGAAAGLVCGPGAPVCVTIGVFVGGAIGALGADFAVDWAWRWK